LSTTVSVVKSAGKLVQRTLAPVGLLLKGAILARTMTANLTVSGILGRLNTALLSATLTTTAGITRACAKSVAAALGLLATLRRANVLVMTATVGSLASMLRGKFTPAVLATSITTAASMLFSRGRLMTVVVSVTPALVRTIAFSLRVAVHAAALAQKGVQKACSLALTLSPVLAARKAIAAALSASVALTAGILSPATLRRTLVGVLSLTTGFTRTVGKVLSDGLSGVATLLRPSLRAVALTVLITGAPNLTAAQRIVRGLSATLTAGGALVAGWVARVSLTAGNVAAAGLAKQVGKPLLVLLTTAPRLLKLFPFRLLAAVTVSPVLALVQAAKNVIDLARRVLAPWRIRTWRA
jgi:hypothetical protein